MNVVSGGNRELYFPSYYVFADKRLKNHKIKTEYVIYLDFCELLCYQHDDCVSINIKKHPDSATGQQKCELNNSTHMEHDEDLKNDNAYLYQGAKVITIFTFCPRNNQLLDKKIYTRSRNFIVIADFFFFFFFFFDEKKLIHLKIKNCHKTFRKSILKNVCQDDVSTFGSRPSLKTRRLIPFAQNSLF